MAAVTVSTQYPIIAWASGVSGAGTIYASGSTIDNSLLTAVQSAATAAGVNLTVGSFVTPPDAAGLTKATADKLYDPLGAAAGSTNYTLDGGTP